MKLKTCFLAAVLIVSATAVFAQEKTVSPYASIRYFVGAYYQDKQFLNSGAAKADRYDIDLVNNMIPGTSRFGSRFASGNVTGQIELGLFGGHNGRVGVRQAWGAYKFDFGLTVLAGNTDAPWWKPMGSETWDVMSGPGTAYGDRAPRIRLSYAAGPKGSYVYLDLQRAPVNGSIDGSIGNWAQLYNGKDQIMPVTTVGYELKTDAIDIGVGVAGYKWFLRKGKEGGPPLAPSTTFTWVDANDDGIVDSGELTGTQGSGPVGDTLNPSAGLADANALDHSLGSYMAFLNGHIKLGGPFVKFNIAYQKAPVLMGLYSAGPYFNPYRHAGNTDVIKASDAFIDGALELGFRVPDTFAISVTGGYTVNISDAKNPDRFAIGLNIDIPVAKNFRVVPTALYMNEHKNKLGKQQGADCLAGLKLQLDL